MTFYWKISTEGGYDRLSWYLDGILLQDWSGTSNWNPATIKVPASTHTIKWAYEKNAAGSAKFDAVWVDKVVFTKTGVAPIYELLLLQ